MKVLLTPVQKIATTFCRIAALPKLEQTLLALNLMPWALVGLVADPFTVTMAAVANLMTTAYFVERYMP